MIFDLLITDLTNRRTAAQTARAALINQANGLRQQIQDLETKIASYNEALTALQGANH